MTAIYKRGLVEDNPALEAVIARGMTQTSYVDRDGRIYASASAVCARQTALASTFSGIDTITASSKIYMGIGERVEDEICKALARENRLLFSQYKVLDVGLNTGGKVDALIYHNGKIQILEIKTCGELPPVPKPAHLAQTTMYSSILGLDAIIIYQSRSVADWKGNLKIRSFDLNLSEEAKQAAIFTTAYGYYAIQEEVIPDKPLAITKAICGFCRFIPNCWEDEPFDTTMRFIDPKIHIKLVERASDAVKRIMDPAAVRRRTNGTLKHIAEYGTEFARELLKSPDWSSMI